ncbi:MAG: CopG family ribbon-helix-helix protein [Thermoplasmatota archaeon]
MAVVSVSLPDELVASMDEDIQRRNFKGRSEWLRAAAREHLQQTTESEGHLHGSITLSYKHGHENRISDVRHQFHDVVLSMMHTHCDPTLCMDVLIVGGPAETVRELQATLLRLPAIKTSVLVAIE